MAVSNREIASLVWLGVGLATAIRLIPDFRKSLWRLLKVAVHPYIVVPIVILAGWTVGLVALADLIGLWHEQLRIDALTWFVTVGIAYFFSIHKVSEDNFMRKALRRAIGPTVFVEVYLNLAVLPLAAELVVLPLITFLVLLATVSESKEEYANVRRILNVVLGVIGIGFLVYVTARLVAHFDPAFTWRALLLPVWLTVLALPLIYLAGLLSAYQQTFARLDLFARDAPARRRAKRAVFRVSHLQATEVAGVTGHWLPDLAGAATDPEAREVLRRCRHAWRDERKAERAHNVRDFMEQWFSHTDLALAGVWADAVRDAWPKLDAHQRATLKDEGLRNAPTGSARNAIARLPA